MDNTRCRVPNHNIKQNTATLPSSQHEQGRAYSQEAHFDIRVHSPLPPTLLLFISLPRSPHSTTSSTTIPCLFPDRRPSSSADGFGFRCSFDWNGVMFGFHSMIRRISCRSFFFSSFRPFPQRLPLPTPSSPTLPDPTPHSPALADPPSPAPPASSGVDTQTRASPAIAANSVSSSEAGTQSAAAALRSFTTSPVSIPAHKTGSAAASPFPLPPLPARPQSAPRPVPVPDPATGPHTQHFLLPETSSTAGTTREASRLCSSTPLSTSCGGFWFFSLFAFLWSSSC
ncbi:hypothetical protein BLNAU_8541 [Blattamonas nauphoetae]|uniref:Uncharacterized protein n=1 Tax=Blattamonas nauphoetae TaxID=2049346 RepID=A0ABQ9XYB4_9EUKA|nr:hypothetical protein BLNAU_8541 [Blattamonas nauphoetae]